MTIYDYWLLHGCCDNQVNDFEIDQQSDLSIESEREQREKIEYQKEFRNVR